MDARSPTRRHAVELSPRARTLIFAWATAVLVVAGFTLALGWHDGSAVGSLANLVIWPGSVPVLIVIGALPSRGGALVAAGCATFIGLTCAALVTLLPDASLPIEAGHAQRWHYIVEALGISPLIGLLLGVIGVGLRTMTLEAVQSVASWAREVDEAGPRVAAELDEGGELPWAHVPPTPLTQAPMARFSAVTKRPTS
jgi:hypothetical protein